MKITMEDECSTLNVNDRTVEDVFDEYKSHEHQAIKRIHLILSSKYKESRKLLIYAHYSAVCEQKFS